MDAPNLNVINEYKREFLLRRLLQTALGGPRLRLPFPAPLYVPAVQLLLWLAPALLGVPLSLLVPARWAALVAGLAVAALGVAVQTVGVVAAKHDTQEDVKTSMLAQDDEVEFRGLCHWSTWGFIVPGKRKVVNVLLQPLLGGVTTAAATFALSAENFDNIVNRGSWLVAVYPVLGWFTVCTAVYSVTVSVCPEPATLRAPDDWELVAAYRPLYLVLLTLPLITIKLQSELGWLLAYDAGARLCLCILPLLWLVGVLPPWDVGLTWLAEQIMVFVFGGSACVTVRRLMLQLVLSTAQVVLLLFLPARPRLYVAAATGCLLSADLVGAGLWLGRALTRLRSERPSPRPGWARSLLYHCTAALAACGVAAATSLLSRPPGALPALCGVLVVVMVTRAVFVELQLVYSLGLFKNKLYQPAECGGRQRWVRMVALGIHTLVTPLLLILCMGWEIAAGVLQPSWSPKLILSTVFVARFYRWVWQSTDCALWETVAVCVLRLLAPSATAGWTELALAAASLLRDRLTQLALKLYGALVLQGTWLTVKEKRRGRVLLAINAAILPLSVATVLLSCVFSAPLLPVFTLPLLLPTFPRRLGGRQPGRPQLAGPDAVYYSQMAADTAHRLGNAVWTGCAGFVKPGDYLLLRFDDRLMWVYLAEMGHGYIYFNIKGLELQETSCHAAEATRVDAVFDAAFDEDMVVGQPGRVAPYWYNTLTPLTQLQVPGYSDARSQLTGVIDNSMTLDAIQELFPKVVTWMVLSQRLSAGPSDSAADAGADAGGGSPPRADSLERYRTALSSPVPQPPLVPSQLADWSDDGSAGSLLFERKRPAARPLAEAAPWLQKVLAEPDEVPDPAVPPEPVASTQIRVHSLTSPPLGAPSADASRLSARRGTLPPIASASASPPAASASGSAPGSPVRRGSRMFSSPRVAPMLDSGAPSQTQSPSAGSSRRLSRPAWEPSSPLVTEQRPRSGLAARLTPPAAWRAGWPAARPVLAAPFPTQFWRDAAARLSPPQGELEEQLQEEYQRLVQLLDTAYHGTLREIQVQSTPSRVYGLYKTGPSGDSAETSWLRACPDLAALAQRAYRWTVKLALDSLLLGGFDSDAELLDTLLEYRDSWHIGLDTDPGWREAISRHTPFLFALGYDDNKDTYTSHLLTLGPQTVSVGRLSSELVRGIWANLALELLYVTNDDEERYSIQAHPTILRNLTVQAADPPLGYPVFVSAPLLSTCV